MPATRHGQQPVPVPAIRGQGSPTGMPAYPPKLAAWKTMAACEAETAALFSGEDDGGLWGMPVCPPVGQRGRRPSGARDEDDGQPRRATRKAGEATRLCDEEGGSRLAGAPRASEEEAPRRPVATPPWPPLEEARAGRA